MLIVQVVIFAGEFRPYLRNDIQSFQDFTYFLSSGDGYWIPVGKQIYGRFIQTQNLGRKIYGLILDQSHMSFLPFILFPRNI